MRCGDTIAFYILVFNGESCHTTIQCFYFFIFVFTYSLFASIRISTLPLFSPHSHFISGWQRWFHLFQIPAQTQVGGVNGYNIRYAYSTRTYTNCFWNIFKLCALLIRKFIYICLVGNAFLRANGNNANKSEAFYRMRSNVENNNGKCFVLKLCKYYVGGFGAEGAQS